MSLASRSYASTAPTSNDDWLFGVAERCDTGRCAALLAQLDAMPRTAWLEIGRRELASERNAGAARENGEATLARTLAERDLGMTAWLVRDAVDTAAYGAGSGSLRTSRGRVTAAPCSAVEQRLLVAARHAAQVAALAHLVRPWLSRDAYVALIAPFFFVAPVGT